MVHGVSFKSSRHSGIKFPNVEWPLSESCSASSYVAVWILGGGASNEIYCNAACVEIGARFLEYLEALALSWFRGVCPSLVADKK